MMESIVKWKNELNRQFSKQEQTDNKYMKKCSQHPQPSAIEFENAIENYAEIPSYSS